MNSDAVQALQAWLKTWIMELSRGMRRDSWTQFSLLAGKIIFLLEYYTLHKEHSDFVKMLHCFNPQNYNDPYVRMIAQSRLSSVL